MNPKFSNCLPRIKTMFDVNFSKKWAEKAHVTNTIELVQVLNGTLKVVFEKDIIELLPGDVIFIPSHTSHLDVFSQKQKFEVFMIFFRWTPEKDFFREVDLGVFCKAPHDVQYEIRSILLEMRSDRLDNPVSRTINQHRLLTILLLLYRSAKGIATVTRENKLTENKHKWLANEVKIYIQRNLQNKIKMNDISRKVEVSPNYLSLIFKKEIGMSIFQYIVEAKMETAKQYLLDGKLFIEDIAALTGYSNANYFSKAFRKYFGCSPARFRDMKIKPRGC